MSGLTDDVDLAGPLERRCDFIDRDSLDRERFSDRGERVSAYRHRIDGVQGLSLEVQALLAEAQAYG